MAGARVATRQRSVRLASPRACPARACCVQSSTSTGTTPSASFPRRSTARLATTLVRRQPTAMLLACIARRSWTAIAPLRFVLLLLLLLLRCSVYPGVPCAPEEGLRPFPHSVLVRAEQDREACGDARATVVGFGAAVLQVSCRQQGLCMRGRVRAATLLHLLHRLLHLSDGCRSFWSWVLLGVLRKKMLAAAAAAAASAADGGSSSSSAAAVVPTSLTAGTTVGSLTISIIELVKVRRRVVIAPSLVAIAFGVPARRRPRVGLPLPATPRCRRRCSRWTT